MGRVIVGCIKRHLLSSSLHLLTLLTPLPQPPTLPQIQYMKFLIHPVDIYTRLTIPDATTVLTSLLTDTVPDAVITLDKYTSPRGRTQVDLIYGASSTDIEAYDLTFAGPYDPTTSTYIVHGLEDPLPVPATFTSLSAFFTAPSSKTGRLSFSVSSSFWKSLEKSTLKTKGLATVRLGLLCGWLAWLVVHVLPISACLRCVFDH